MRRALLPAERSSSRSVSGQLVARTRVPEEVAGFGARRLLYPGDISRCAARAMCVFQRFRARSSIHRLHRSVEGRYRPFDAGPDSQAMAGAGTDTAATGRRSPQPQPRGPLCARCGRGESSGGCDVADDAGDLDSAKHLPLQGATAPPSSAPRQSPGRWTPLGAGSLEAQRGHDGGQPQQPPNGHYYYCAVTPGIHPSTYVDPSASSPSFASAPCRPSTSVDLSHLSSPVAVCTDDGSYFSDPACLAHRGPLSLPRALSSSSSSSSCSTSTSSSRSRHSKHKQRRRDNDAQLCRLRPKLPSLKAMARRESLSELRAANPELALSGNIISATFNLPHALTYRRDGDWVERLSPSADRP